MDVVCGRCKADYEFDDALISERGTTVRCTNCGLQFKVFPPVGHRAPEVWRVFDPEDRRGEPAVYESLPALQRAIASGRVGARHLLARGREEPRELSEIVELQPLLRQPPSSPPPPLEEGSSESSMAPIANKTVLGIEARPDPALVMGRSPPGVPPEFDSASLDQLDAPLESDVGHDAIVPFQPPEPMEGFEPDLAPAGLSNEQGAAVGTPAFVLPQDELAGHSSHAQGEAKGGVFRSERVESDRPKIRSALSIAPPLSSEGPSSSRPPAKVRTGSLAAPRASLRSTIAPSTPAEVQEPESVPPQSSLVSDESEPASPLPTSSSPVPQNSSESTGQSTRPPVSDSSKRGASSKDKSSVASVPISERPRRVSAPGAPVSSMTGAPRRRGARSGGMVVAVLLGGAAFLGFANRESLKGMLNTSSNVGAEKSAKAFVSSELSERLVQAEIKWIEQRLLLQVTQLAPQLRGELTQLALQLRSAGAQESWEMVQVLRAQNELGEARRLAALLPPAEDYSYHLALLDLAEDESEIPWSGVIERLREASAGERGIFLARTVYIYSLAASGRAPRAQADFQAMSKLKGAQKSPLFEVLGDFVDKVVAESNSSPSPGTPRVAESPQEGRVEAEQPSPSSAVKEEEPEKSQPAVAPSHEVKGASGNHSEVTPPEPKKKLPPGVEKKVGQADALWRGGNREAALALYRQVVTTIGTSHFLGQRSAARIRQAEREKAAEQ